MMVNDNVHTVRILLHFRRQGDEIFLSLAAKDKKVKLEDSEYIRRLTDAETGRGGGGIQ